MPLDILQIKWRRPGNPGHDTIAAVLLKKKKKSRILTPEVGNVKGMLNEG